jgi:radical SAM protein with 4Fe4S-binding SPASM domain
MYTNGLLLTDKLIDSLVHSRLHSVNISIDAATKQTYERIRVGGSFDKLMANIAALQRAKRVAGTSTPHVFFGFVLMRSNIAELPALVRLAAELGVSTVGAIHVMEFDLAKAKGESLLHDTSLCNRMLDEARTEAARLNVTINLPDNFAPSAMRSHFVTLPHDRIRNANRGTFWFLDQTFRDPFRSHCQFPWNFLGIEVDGSVQPCGWFFDEDPVGNVLTESFEDLWNNAAYRRLRSEHTGGRLRSTCATCPSNGIGSVDDANAFGQRQYRWKS